MTDLLDTAPCKLHQYWPVRWFLGGWWLMMKDDEKWYPAHRVNLYEGESGSFFLTRATTINLKDPRILRIEKLR